MRLLICYFTLMGFVISGHCQTNENLTVETYKLENGLTVFLNKDTTATKVFGAVMVNAGAKHEDPTATGMAHYLEHLLFKGTDELGTWDFESEKPHLDSITLLYEKLASTTEAEQKSKIQTEINKQAVAASQYALPNEFDQLLKSIGSTGVNAFTNYEMTFYHNSFPSHEIDKWLDIYSTRFEEPIFRSFQSELEVVYEEKNRAMDGFERRIFERMGKMTFPNLPYGQWSVLGTVEHLKTPSLAKMYDFYSKNYVPCNMAVILTGNFDEAKVKQSIEAKFGDWEAKPVPEDSFPDLEKIIGEKVEKSRMTPVKVGFLGFQTVPQNHPDRLALDICEFLLYNESNTGYINQIEMNNEMIYAGGFSSVYNDAGNFVIFFVPKILVQSLGNAEKKIESALEKVRGGDFSDELLAAAKSTIGRRFESDLENLTDRGILIGQAFNAGFTWQEALSYPSEISKISRAEVIRVAQQYFGENRAKLISRTGFPKKEKLEKPPYKPVATDQTKSSDYAQSFQQIPSLPYNPKFLDFDKDIERATLTGGHQIVTSLNPINDLFELEVRFKKGYKTDPKIEYAAQIANMAGTSSKSLNELKEAFSSIACSYRIYADINHVYVKLSGKEETLTAGLELTQQLLSDLNPTDKTKAVLSNTIGTARKLEKRTPSSLGSAMLNYASHGEDSYFLNRLSEKEIKKLDMEELKKLLEDVVKNYEAEIIYSGKLSAQELSEVFEKSFALSRAPKSIAYQTREIKDVPKSKVLFIHSSKSVQSQIYYTMPGTPVGKDDYVAKEAFNQYFGGGFSGIVLQEIREYRSLAYSAWAAYQVSSIENDKSRYVGYIGCQADKTIDALKVMNELLADMPSKEERIPSLSSNLQLKTITDYPEFRNRADAVLNLERKGFVEDPNKTAFDAYESLTMEDINKFYEDRIKDKPYLITIYGDKKRINLKELKKLGEVEVLKLKDIMNF